MSFYDEMAAMTNELLAPTGEGGLGQGSIELVRTTYSGLPDEWGPPAGESQTSYSLKGAARGVDADLVGVEVGGTVLVATDLVVTCAPLPIDYEAGDQLRIDGRLLNILSYQKIPAAGTTAAVKFIVRG